MDSHSTQSPQETETPEALAQKSQDNKMAQSSEEKKSEEKKNDTEKEDLGDLNDDWFRSDEWKESLESEDYEEADPTDVKKKSISAQETKTQEPPETLSHEKELESLPEKKDTSFERAEEKPKVQPADEQDLKNKQTTKKTKEILFKTQEKEEPKPSAKNIEKESQTLDSQYWLSDLGIRLDSEFEGPLSQNFSENTSKHWSMLAHALEEKVKIAENQQKALLYQVLAELYQYQINDHAKAESFYKESYNQDPLRLPLLVRYSQFLKKKKPDALLVILEKTIELNEQQKQKPQHDPQKTKSLALWLQLEKAYLLACQFQRIDESANFLQKLLRDFPDEAFFPLIKAYAQSQKWDQIFHATKESLLHHESLSNETVIMRLQLLCQLALFGIRDVQEIIPYAQRLLQKDTQNSIGLQAITLGYTQKQDYHGLVDFLLSLVKTQPHHHEYYQIYRTIGFISKERLNNYKLAETYLSLCFQHSPNDQFVAQNLIETLEYLQNFKDLFSVYEQLVATHANNKDKALWYRKLGSISENDLKAEDQAIGYYRQAMELKSDDVLAISSLGRLYHRTHRWNELYRLYHHEIELTKDPQHKKSLQMQAAYVAEEYLESSDKAMSLYEAILAVQPDDILAMKKLIPLYYQKQKFRELIELSQREADKTFDTQKKARIFERIAKTCESELKDFAQAELFYTKVLELIPTANHIFQNLGRIYHATKQYVKLRDLYLQEAEIEEDSDTSLMCYFKAAEISENHLDNLEKASQIYQQILEQNPTYELAIKGYAKLLHKQKEFSKLATLFAKEAEHTPNAIRTGQLYAQAARMYLDYLNDKESAKKFYALAISAHPYAVEFYDEYFRIINLHSSAETKIQELQDLISLAPIPEIKMKLLQKLSSLFEGNSQQLKNALACYEQILDLQKHAHHSTIFTVINLCLRMRDFDRLSQFLTKYNNDAIITGIEPPDWKAYREQILAICSLLQKQSKNEALTHLQNAFFENSSTKNIFSLGTSIFFEASDFEKVSVSALEQFANTLLDVHEQIAFFWQMFQQTTSKNIAVFSLKKLFMLQKNYPLELLADALPAAFQDFSCSHDLIRLQVPNLDRTLDPVEKTYWLFQCALMILADNGNIDLAKKLLDYIFVYQKNSLLGQASVETLQKIQSKNKIF